MSSLRVDGVTVTGRRSVRSQESKACELLTTAEQFSSQIILLQDVCLSVTHQYSIETAKHTIRLFSPLGSHTILAFPYQTVWQYTSGDPLTRTSNARGVWKITIFDQYLALSPKWYKKELHLGWLTNRKSYMFYQTVLFSVTSNDLKPRFQGRVVI